MSAQKVIIVIPALNEEETISQVINGVKQYADEVILVDDGSLDKTAVIGRREGARVLCHKENQGYDRSLDDGFALAAASGATVIVTFDGDGQHEPADIPELIEPILNGQADVVVGKRPRYARIAEYLFGFVAKLKANIDDPLCGLKAYHRKVYDDVGYFDRNSSIGSALMFNASKKGYRIIQKNIRLNQRNGSPRFGRRVAANWKIFKAIVRAVC